MAHYVIGDVQGCYDPLMNLLERINYNSEKDTLIFAGDIINRGPKSLDTIRFIMSQKNAIVTLGNHDLYFLALATNAVEYPGKHTLAPLFSAPDCADMIHWLRHQPMLYCNETFKTLVTHAGILPTWSIDDIQLHAKELEAVLQSDGYIDFLKSMLGDSPALWQDDLQGYDRLRFITNALTRMRFCDKAGNMEFETKSQIESPHKGYKKWFEWPRDLQGYNICFGHFAAILGHCPAKNIFALDTGCVWGYQLSALRLEDQKIFSVGA